MQSLGTSRPEMRICKAIRDSLVFVTQRTFHPQDSLLPYFCWLHYMLYARSSIFSFHQNQDNSAIWLLVMGCLRCREFSVWRIGLLLVLNWLLIQMHAQARRIFLFCFDLFYIYVYRRFNFMSVQARRG